VHKFISLAHQKKRRIGIESGGGLIEEEDRGRGDQLDAHGHATRLHIREGC